MTAKKEQDTKKRRPRSCPECGGRPGDSLFGGSRRTSYWCQYGKRNSNHDHMNAHLCRNTWHDTQKTKRIRLKLSTTTAADVDAAVAVLGAEPMSTTDIVELRREMAGPSCRSTDRTTYERLIATIALLDEQLAAALSHPRRIPPKSTNALIEDMLITEECLKADIVRLTEERNEARRLEQKYLGALQMNNLTIERRREREQATEARLAVVLAAPSTAPVPKCLHSAQSWYINSEGAVECQDCDDMFKSIATDCTCPDCGEAVCVDVEGRVLGHFDCPRL